MPLIEDGTLSTGVSINALFNVIFCESYKSEQRIIQSIGRSLRKHDEKSMAVIFDLVDVFREDKQRNSFYRHSKERQKFYDKHHYPYKMMNFVLEPPE